MIIIFGLFAIKIYIWERFFREAFLNWYRKRDTNKAIEYVDPDDEAPCAFCGSYIERDEFYKLHKSQKKMS
jgi:hypothetical protein